MIHEYKCKRCMRITMICVFRKPRETVLCKYCNGEASKNGKIISDKACYYSEKKPKEEWNILYV